MKNNPSREKDDLRQVLTARWAELWPEGGETGRPPLFSGSGKAAERLRRVQAWRLARTVMVMANPTLLQVRVNTLAGNKSLIAATPSLKQGLVRLTSDQVPVASRWHDLRGWSLAQTGTVLRFPEARLAKVDMLVGAVMAVDRQGRTLGDGRGLFDLTYAVLRQLGAVSEKTPVVVLAADEQVIEHVPGEAWDLAADLIVTPSEVLRIENPQRPRTGLDDLPEHLARLPLVQAVRENWPG